MSAVAASGVNGASHALDDPAELEAFTRWEQHEGGARVAESSLRIGGMHCSACAGTIECALKRVPGVLSAARR